MSSIPSPDIPMHNMTESGIDASTDQVNAEVSHVENDQESTGRGHARQVSFTNVQVGGIANQSNDEETGPEPSLQENTPADANNDVSIIGDKDDRSPIRRWSLIIRGNSGVKRITLSAGPLPRSVPEAHATSGVDRSKSLPRDGLRDDDNITTAEEKAVESEVLLHDLILSALDAGDVARLKDVMDEAKEGSPGVINLKFGKMQETPLHLSLRYGSQELRPAFFKVVMAYEPDIEAPDKDGRTPLIAAAGCGVTEVIEILLVQNCSINAPDNRKLTALHFAASNGREEIVRRLLKHGANPNTKSVTGRSPIHSVSSRGYHDVLELLLLIDSIDVNPKDFRGSTPLHNACTKNHDNVVRTLLENGGDVNARSNKGWTPLHIAARKHNAVIVQDLLEAGADTMIYSQQLELPESLVPRRYREEIVDLLKRQDIAGRTLANRTGKELNVSKPSPDQERTCHAFEGFIWPSVDKTFRYDTVSVWDMLYSETPKITKLRRGRAPQWVHLPYNNRTWVEDVFKLIYSENNEDMEAKGKESELRPPSTQGSPTSLRNILQFLAAEFAEIPIIDVDMQQPYYYQKPSDDQVVDIETEVAADETWVATERRLVKKYASNEGRPLTPEEEDYIDKMWDLGKYYEVHNSRSLDESFHELLDADDINQRNGDQVLSRYLARFRLDAEQDKEAAAGSDRESLASERLEATKVQDQGHGGFHETKRQDRKYSEEKVTAEHDQNENKASVETQRRSSTQDAQQTQQEPQLSGHGDEPQTEKEPPEGLTNKPNPSQLESQDKGPRRRAPKWLSRIVASFKKRKHSGASSRATKETTYYDSYFSSSYASSVSGGSDQSENENSSKRPRQQILIVPQLWIWKIENVIVTTFPERWDSSNPRVLAKIMLANIEERNRTAKKEQMFEDMDVQGVLYGILESCLGFEPLFSTYDEERGYHDAFAAEIAYVVGDRLTVLATSHLGVYKLTLPKQSSQTTACYHKYRESLGETEQSFANAGKEETELLILIDDILSEIAMIKRAHEDQSQVCVAMKAEQDASQTLSNTRERSPHLFPSQKSPTRPPGLRHSQTGDIHLDLPHFQDFNRARPTPTRRPDTKLLRQEEDARRIRESASP
ncbi:hypothetical protein Daus18300_001518 [Diaporthe australafricana]|uniref:Ankyrin repeat protein n=1 Tax=Diaporthe australafricana TaxID=127596 RepID=A0ABR3XWU8_9PEZI